MKNILWEPSQDHPLESGTFGKVYLTTHKYTGPIYPHPFALKIIDIGKMSEASRSLQFQEASLLAKIQSPFFVELIDYYSYRNNLYLVMEYCAGETLVEFSDRYRDERDIQLIIYQILKGLEYLHNRKTLHLDLKLDNVMLCPDYLNIKLIDLGYSLEGESLSIHNKIRRGTPDYDDPERYLIDDKSRFRYSGGMDVWSVGTILFQMLFLENPFTQLSELGKSILYTPTKVRQDDLLNQFYQGIVPFATGPSWLKSRPRQLKIRYRNIIKHRLPNISRDAIEFMESIFVPLDQRPSVDTLLKSKWLSGVAEIYNSLKH
jgi:serine/threonine protein kinase